MRFSGDAYDKLYPRSEEATPVVESAVETFKPTETETNEEATVPKETTETTENTETQESQEEGE